MECAAFHRHFPSANERIVTPKKLGIALPLDSRIGNDPVPGISLETSFSSVKLTRIDLTRALGRAIRRTLSTRCLLLAAMSSTEAQMVQDAVPVAYMGLGDGNRPGGACTYPGAHTR